MDLPIRSTRVKFWLKLPTSLHSSKSLTDLSAWKWRANQLRGYKMKLAHQPHSTNKYLVKSTGRLNKPRKLKCPLLHWIKILVWIMGRHFTLVGQLAEQQENWYVIIVELGATQKKLCQKSAKIGIKTIIRSTWSKTECSSFTFSNTSLKPPPYSLC